MFVGVTINLSFCGQFQHAVSGVKNKSTNQSISQPINIFTSLDSFPPGMSSYGGIRPRYDVTTCLQEWTSWRTHLNRSLIIKAELTQRLNPKSLRVKTPNSKRMYRKVVRAPNMEIDKPLSDFVFQRALDDRFGGGRGYIVMSPESFIAFGIPRPKTSVPRSQHSDIPNGIPRSNLTARLNTTNTLLNRFSTSDKGEPKPDYDRITRF